METSVKSSPDAPPVDEESFSIPAANGRGKIRLLSKHDLDGRTSAFKEFEAIARGIAADLGGEDQLSVVQKHLVEAFAGAALEHACHHSAAAAR